MDEIFSKNGSYLVAGVVILGTSYFLLKRLRGKKKRVCGVDYPKDKVIVHQTIKGKYAPSPSHFVVKLETYLRMVNIPYEPNYKRIPGPKNKVPWVEYNGEVYSDSQLIINQFNKMFKVDLNKHLSDQEKAVAWAVQKWLEEFTYWLNVYTRWYLLADDMANYVADVPMKWLLLMFQKRSVKSKGYTVGVGRHSAAEIGQMMVHDMRTLSVILGDKSYLMGDQPTELDCAAFGVLAQVRWQTPDACPGKKVLTEELSNLTSYMDRIKDKYWPDWNERIVG